MAGSAVPDTGAASEASSSTRSLLFDDSESVRGLPAARLLRSVLVLLAAPLKLPALLSPLPLLVGTRCAGAGDKAIEGAAFSTSSSSEPSSSESSSV